MAVSFKVAIALFVVGGVLILVAGGWVTWLILRRWRARRARLRRQRARVVPVVSHSSTSSTVGRTHSVHTNTGYVGGGPRSVGDDRGSTIPSSITPQISGSITTKLPYTVERTNSRLSKLSLRSVRPENKWVTASSTEKRPDRFSRGHRYGKHVARTMSLPRYSTTTDSAIVTHSSTIMPSIYEVKLTSNSRLSQHKHRRSRGSDRLVTGKVQTWLNSTTEPEPIHPSGLVPGQAAVVVEQDHISSSPSRASSAPAETSSHSTPDLGQANRLCIRWSPSMNKRRSFGSEGTGQTITTIHKDSETSWTTDPRSFIVTRKTVIPPPGTAEVQQKLDAVNGIADNTEAVGIPVLFSNIIYNYIGH